MDFPSVSAADGKLKIRIPGKRDITGANGKARLPAVVLRPSVAVQKRGADICADRVGHLLGLCQGFKQDRHFMSPKLLELLVPHYTVDAVVVEVNPVILFRYLADVFLYSFCNLLLNLLKP